MKQIKLLFLFLAACVLTQAEEKHISVIIPSYNNSQWYQKNLDSVCNQKNVNYHIYYIDDASTDNTYQLVKNYIEFNNYQDKVTLIGNTQRLGALANLYHAIHNCKNDEIIVTVDGDDWLAHEMVLEHVQAAYQDPNVWLTYGTYQSYPDNRIGDCRQIPDLVKDRNIYREYDWCSSHLRTFYAGLFKQVKLKDLLIDGNFFDVTWDMAMIFPMLEMAAGKFKGINQILYIYNCDNVLNDFKTKTIDQIHCDKYIRSKKKYTVLRDCPNQLDEPACASMIIFSADSPTHLRMQLRSLKQFATNFTDIQVLYVAADNHNDGYTQLKYDYSFVKFIHCDSHTFKTKTMQAIYCAQSPYVVCAHDSLLFTKPVDLTVCTKSLLKTKAYGFDLALGTHIVENKYLEQQQRNPGFLDVGDGVYGWQFQYGEGDWAEPHLLGVIYEKNMLFAKIQSLKFTNSKQLKRGWSKLRVDGSEIGLIFKSAKTVASYRS